MARIPTVPLGGRGAVIVALMGGSVTAAGPMKIEMISLSTVPHRFAVTATLAPSRTFTVR